MISCYFYLKWLHILSSVLLVGTGFGSAFYLHFTHKTGNQIAITEVIRLVVKADYWFILPTIIVQPATGLAMLSLNDAPINQLWIISAMGLYLIAGFCYIPVFFFQLKMLKLAANATTLQQPLPTQYWRLAKYWEWLGYPAFAAMLGIFWLMVFKPI